MVVVVVEGLGHGLDLHDVGEIERRRDVGESVLFKRGGIDSVGGCTTSFDWPSWERVYEVSLVRVIDHSHCSNRIRDIANQHVNI